MTGSLSIPTELTHTHFLSAAGCNAQSELPLPTLARQVIELATAHANRLGIGYTRLMEDSAAWVLSRMSFAIGRMPHMHSTYALTTWIESINRHFSERCFELADAESGAVLGHVRTVWMAIDINSRRPADLEPIADTLQASVSTRRCPSPRPAKIKLPDFEAPAPEGTGFTRRPYTFTFTDTDFNRHVNTVRYVELALDTLPVEAYDAGLTSRFDIAFHAETLPAQTVEIYSAISRGADGTASVAAAFMAGGACRTSAAFTLTPRN